MRHLNLKAFAAKDYHQQNKKKTPTEWDKIIANDMTNKKLISKICNQLIQFNIKNKRPIQKMGRRQEQILFQRIHNND